MKQLLSYGGVLVKASAIKTAVIAGFMVLAVASTGSGAAEREEVAIKGYCPVSYFTAGRAVLGNSAFASTFQGYAYHFADADAKAKFDAEPVKYAPQFAGLCTTALGGSYGNRFAADPEVFRIVDAKLYLFSVVRAQNNFDEDPKRYVTMGNERFGKPALGGFCPTSYVTAGKAVRGDDKFKQVYRGVVYYFADAAAADAFAKDPAKYLPAYDGFCAEGVANEKRYPGDPNVFAVHNGGAYFFFDAKAKAAFEAHPAETIKKADANWPKVREVKRTP